MTLTMPHDKLLQTLDRIDHDVQVLQEALTKKHVARAIDKHAKALQPTLATLFKRQGGALVRSLSTMRKHFAESTSSEFDDIFDSATLDTSTDMHDSLQDAIESALLAGGKDLIKEFSSDLAFSLTTPRAEAYYVDYGASLIKNIDDVSRERIKTIVLAGIENGTSYSEVARQIKAEYKQMAIGMPQKHIRSRAELIAVTEMGNAYSEGNLIAALELQDAGLAMQKSWLTIGDRRVSAGCKDNAGVGWIDLDDDFPSGHARPLRFPGCRCVALYRRKRS